MCQDLVLYAKSIAPHSANGNVEDAPSAGFAVLGFFIPIVGLILFLVWHDTYPLRAKSAGKGALISVIIGIGLTIMGYLLYFAALSQLF